MTDPQPSCSENKKIALSIVALIGPTDDNTDYKVEDAVLKALEAKQKTIEEKEADLKWYAEVHEPEAIRLATESLRAEVEALKKEIGNREV